MTCGMLRALPFTVPSSATFKALQQLHLRGTSELEGAINECGKYFSSAYSLSTVVQPVTQSQTLLLGHLPDLVMVHKRNLVGAVQGP